MTVRAIRFMGGRVGDGQDKLEKQIANQEMRNERTVFSSGASAATSDQKNREKVTNSAYMETESEESFEKQQNQL